MTHSVALDALPGWFSAELRGAGNEVAVLAGHFAIFSAGGVAADLLTHGEEVPTGAAAMVAFTRRSWQLACDAAVENGGGHFRLVVMVDDIQFVRPVTTERSVTERLAAALVRDYLLSARELPPYHAAMLQRSRIDPARVIRWSGDRWLFSERELREAAVHHLRSHVALRGGDRIGVTSADNGNTVNVRLPEQGNYCMVQSGHTSCAGGYVELLSTLYDRGVRKLIALVPGRCLGQVALGTELARHLYELKDFAVINVALPEGDSAGGAIISR
jgi:hypothetical protein